VIKDWLDFIVSCDAVLPGFLEPPRPLNCTDPGLRTSLSVLSVLLRAPSLNCVSVSRGICCHHVPKYDEFRNAKGVWFNRTIRMSLFPRAIYLNTIYTYTQFRVNQY